MFKDLTEKDIFDYENMNLVYMAHDFSVSPERFNTDKKLNEFWDVLSLSSVSNGTEYVSSIESKDHPIIGV